MRTWDGYGESRFAVRKVLRSASRRANWILQSVVFTAVNRLSRRSAVSPSSGVIVAMASHGGRARTAHLTIESIARGVLRPSRLVVYTTLHASLPKSLERLRRRGVEFLPNLPHLGPHNKYFSYVNSVDEHVLPMVTADDDVFYTKRWLSELMTAFESDGRTGIVANSAKYMEVRGGQVLPYRQWRFCSFANPEPRVFTEGVWGVLYPPAFLNSLRNAGDGFLSCSPAADDVWLNVNALRAGIPVRQRLNRPSEGTPRYLAQSQGLARENVVGQGNDQQISATYSADDIEMLASD